MQFAYDSEQPHQLAAVNAVVDLFDGQHFIPPKTTAVEIPGWGSARAVPNRMTLPETRLLENLQGVQARSGQLLAPGGMDSELARIVAPFSDESVNGMLAGKESRFPNFSVEMETGTGKTYVYLRTIRELARRCGFLKFIVVTPSIAVREGVLHAIRSADAHLAEVCKISCGGIRYDSAQMARVSDFARSTKPRVMVVTIDSIKRDNVLLLRSSEGLIGEVPLHFIQACRPILILDEPQNMETDPAREALARLNPIFALRYSATHKRGYNMVHRLSPMAAYRAGLVKALTVESVEIKGAEVPYFRLISLKTDGVVPSARVEVPTANGPKRVTLKRNDSVGDKVGLAHYKGYGLEGIYGKPPRADFCGGEVILFPGQAHGEVDKEKMFRAQIAATVKIHFSRQRELRGIGVKVLSLFFIDEVANYRGAGEGDKAPLIRRIFEEEFERLKPREWKNIPASAAHNGYFAKSLGGNSEADAMAYQLIMRDKESLLTFPNPETDDAETLAKRQVAFIFTHSALREGWDNPNIFQICTLNETRSETRKRQEIGRGVRLAVDQGGNRILDNSVNVLTVIANRNYKAYVSEYQSEMSGDCREMLRERLGEDWHLPDAKQQAWINAYMAGASPKPIRRTAQKKAKANPNHIKAGPDGRIIFSAEFKRLWERIQTRTEYIVKLSGPKLAAAAARKLKAKHIPDPEVIQTGAVVVVNYAGGYEAHPTGRQTERLESRRPLPDLAETVNWALMRDASPLRLSRPTICRIARADLDRAFANPYDWSRCAAEAIREALADMLQYGVVYEKAKRGHYEWRPRFKREFPIVSEHIARIRGDAKNAAYSVFACDSNLETDFARDLANRKDVKLFLKLPRWFMVPTPVGNYNPDWAILFADGKGGEKLVLVAETKGRVDDNGNIMAANITPDELVKIRCAAAHFGSKRDNIKGALDGTDFLPLKNADQLPFQNE